jgi:hypothetical protein
MKFRPWPPIMLSTLTVVLPIFALIFAGWLVRRIGVLGEHATTELNRFVVYLALPALLFDIIAKALWFDIWQPAFIARGGVTSSSKSSAPCCAIRSWSRRPWAPYSRFPVLHCRPPPKPS